jgi:hypothetical protein
MVSVTKKLRVRVCLTTLSVVYRCQFHGDTMTSVRYKKIRVRVCVFVGTNMRVGIIVEFNPKWLGLGRNPEVRSPTENRRVITIVPGLHSSLVAPEATWHI